MKNWKLGTKKNNYFPQKLHTWIIEHQQTSQANKYI